MRPLMILAALLVTGCSGAVGGGTTGSSASCVAPTLAVAPATVAPGGSVQVTGDYFVATCNDTRVNGQQPAPPAPLADLTLMVRQGDRAWTLAEHVDAVGELGEFETDATLPSEVGSGAAFVFVPGYGAPVAVTVG